MERQTAAALPRRGFLGLLGAAILPGAEKPRGRPLRGIFPIAQTPFTESDKLDLDALVAEVRFVDRCGAHGLVWPQLASEYSTLTPAERLSGAEAILGVGESRRPAIVIGVQAPDSETAVRYAKHAAGLGADALIALPPANQTDPAAILAYYQAIGAASELPLFAQAVGSMSIEFIVQMSKAIPTLRYVKDEAGASPIGRIGPLREQSADTISVFTGGHGVTLIDEMMRGSAGSMPAASFADLYAQVWDHWQAGRRREAVDAFSRALLFVPEAQVYGIQSLKYLLYLRGVFPTYATRVKDARAPFDETARRALRELLEFVKPQLRT
jgi:4-hydroxy-tetrahydrodipicolinate synthase